jgi:pimeloyl-ACP methyl ester carboxylesterase
MTNSHNTTPTQFIEASCVRYAYRRFGADNGTPIVFLQHFRGGLDNWDPKVTDGLAKDRPVILFNNAGVASSGGEPADTVSGMAKHVVAFINALGLKRVDLLGFSLGGFVAQQVVLENPDLIRRVVLAGTGPQGGDGMDAFTPKVAEHATQETPVMENFLYLFFSPSETSQAAGRAFWERRHTRAEQDIPSSIAAMHAQAAAIAQWGAVPKTSRYGQLKRITQPVLIVNGNEDIMVPSINSFILDQHIPNATLIVYPDSGHGAIFQYPELFVSHMRLFLDEQPARESRSAEAPLLSDERGPSEILGLARTEASVP